MVFFKICTNMLYILLIFLTHAKYPAHLILLDFIAMVDKGNKL
jgi:hypothetical protein